MTITFRDEPRGWPLTVTSMFVPAAALQGLLSVHDLQSHKRKPFTAYLLCSTEDASLCVFPRCAFHVHLFAVTFTCTSLP